MSQESLSEFTILDNQYMQLALTLAKQAAEIGEVPVGAVLVHSVDEKNRKIIGQGYNQPIGNHDPTAHAEIVALRDACNRIKNYRLPKNTTLYVTLEPCTMCVGALIHARLSRLVYSTHEPRAGMVSSQGNLLSADFYNHKAVMIQSGLLAEDSSQLLKDFFKHRRKNKKKDIK